MKLTIDRKRWLRGEGSRKSKMLRESDGKMCCLGFYSLALGYSKEDIEHKDAPCNVVSASRKNMFPSMLIDGRHSGPMSHTNLAEDLMRYNDAIDIPREEREDRITKLFRMIGVEVEFVD